MKLEEAIATGKKIKRKIGLFQYPQDRVYNLKDIQADDWEVEKFALKEMDYCFDFEGVYPSLGMITLSNRSLSRSTSKLASESRKNMLEMQRLDALMRQIDPDWVADWSNNYQRKYYICFNYIKKQYLVEARSTQRNIGAPCCSGDTAEKIIDLLNSGEFSLDDDK